MTPPDEDKPLTYPEELQASIDTYRNLAHQCLDHSQFDDAQRHALFAEGIRYALDHWREMAAKVPTPAACGRHDCYQCAMEDL